MFPQLKKYYIFSEVPLRIQVVILLSFLYWVYLAMTTHMIMVFDGLTYENFGKLLDEKGWMAFFRDAHYEPVFPFLVSLSLKISRVLHISYQTVQVLFNITILLITQILCWKTLNILKVGRTTSALCLLYLGFSPAIVNTAFNLWSEIVYYPIVLGIVLIFYKLWQALIENQKNLWFWAMSFGLVMCVATLTRSLFEAVLLLFALFFIFVMFYFLSKKRTTHFAATCVVLCLMLISFYVPILSYKMLNKIASDHFTITNSSRGIINFYGRTAQRLNTLDPSDYLAATLSVPALNICYMPFAYDKCYYWELMTSDRLGNAKHFELSQQNLSGNAIEKEMISQAVQKISEKPFQYSFFYILGCLQMTFWEGTNIGFVSYPQWLINLFNSEFLKLYLGLYIGFLTIGVLILNISYVIRNKRKVFELQESNKEIYLLLGVLLLVVFYIFIYGFFFVLKRYALPLAPLYLILIGFTFKNRRFPLH